MQTEYPDFVARFYDILYDKIRSSVDHDFYVRKATEASGPVLEIGAGTGRLFCDALAAGVDIVGVDTSPSMIEQLRQKIPSEHHKRVMLADVRHLHLGRRFDLILAPFRVLSHLETIDDQLDALRRVRNHLTEGGRFIFDVFVPDPVLCHQGLRPTVDFEGEWSPGHKLRRTVSVIPRPERQVNEARMLFQWEDGGETHEAEWIFNARYFYRYELEHLIVRAGLTRLACYGDFNEGPLEGQSKEFIMVCTP